MDYIYFLRPQGSRPPFATVAHFLWGSDADFDSDGNAQSPNDILWTELTIQNRSASNERVDIDPIIDDPLTLKIMGSTEILAARTAFFLAEATRGSISETASGPWDSAGYLESDFDHLGNILRFPSEKSEREIIATIGGGVDEVSVTLRFFGDGLEPNELSDLLGSKPTRSYRKGDVRRGKRLDYVEPTGKWLLSLERRQYSEATLEMMIEEIFDQLTNDFSIWKHLSEKYKGNLFCGIWLEEWNRGLVLSPSITQRIAERNLGIDFDIYFVGEEDAF